MRELKSGRKARSKKPGFTPVDDPPNHAILAALTKETMAYRAQLPRLLRKHRGQFVLIKGDEIAGIFPDRSRALDEGYRLFGIVSFLVREITDSEPVVYLPNITP